MGGAAAAASAACKSDSARGAAARAGLVLAGGALGANEIPSPRGGGAASLVAGASLAAPVGESAAQGVASAITPPASREVRLGRGGRGGKGGGNGARCAVGREHGTHSLGRAGAAACGLGAEWSSESPPGSVLGTAAWYGGCKSGGGGGGAPPEAPPEAAGEERKPKEPIGADVGGADEMKRGEHGSAGEVPNCTGELHCRTGDCGGGVTLGVCGGMGDRRVSESLLSVRCAFSCAC